MIRRLTFSSLRRVPTRGTEAHHPVDAPARAALRRVLVRLGALALLAMASAFAAQARPGVPIELVYETPLKKGEWTLAYVYRHIEGDGLRSGSHHITSGDAVSATITQVPTEIETDIHTIGVQYAPFERLTLALSLPLVKRKMRQRDFSGGPGPDPYSTHSSGVGDLEIVGVLPFMKKRGETLDCHLGLRLPTAEIDNKGGAGGTKELLPFSMQSGGRTVSILVGMTYQGYWQGLGWGVHGNGSIGFGDNNRGYRLGNQLAFSGWLAHDVTSWLSGSFRLGFDRWWRLREAQSSGPEDHLASYRHSSAGERLSLSPGLSVRLPGLGEQRLSVEASWPVYQSFEGSQVERDWSVTTGWEWVF